jgi:hypothetical protein
MAANPPVQFARTPAFANNRAIIDYTTREGHTLYYKNIRGFYGTTDTDKFNAQPEGLKGFFNERIQRVDEADWMDLFMVPLDNEEVDGDALFFLKHYGMFSLASLTEYLEVHRVGNQDRWEQDNVQAQMCIINSLSQDAKHRIGVWADDYTIEGEIQALLLLKVIFRESRGDTNHRKLVLRQQLSSLDAKLETLGWSITKLRQASVGERGTISSGINLNPQQPVTANAEIGDTSKDSQSSTMCENRASMCKESIYEDDSKYRLHSTNEGCWIEHNQRRSNEQAIQEIKQRKSKQ